MVGGDICVDEDRAPRLDGQIAAVSISIGYGHRFKKPNIIARLKGNGSWSL